MKKFIILFAAVVFASQAFAQKQRLQKCQPWRSVTGYTQLCTELSFLNCASLMCKGTSAITVVTNSLLQDINSSIYIFSSIENIPVVVQNQVIVQAVNWANAHKPSGYVVEFIKYIPNIVTASGNITYAGIDIKVTYKNCKKSIALPN
jgi:hypothetical protein